MFAVKCTLALLCLVYVVIYVLFATKLALRDAQDHQVIVGARDVPSNKEEECSPLLQQQQQHEAETIVVAIGSGITSMGLAIRDRVKHLSELGAPVTNETVLTSMEFFKTLLPSFCRTAGSRVNRYHYRFYLAHDHDDPLFADRRFVDAFQTAFCRAVGSECGPRSVETSLRLVSFQHSGHPAWAQNDAMMVAYLDGVEYFYRINDDTELMVGDWTDSFIKRLKSFDPPHVGVVGPTHIGGNTGILTYDFVHRTHIDIFGFYYPRLFRDWCADSWITLVYKPNRSSKLSSIGLVHTLALGQRYHRMSGICEKLEPRLSRDKTTLERYVTSLNTSSRMLSHKATSGVVVMSLNCSDPRLAWGAIRNAQLLPVHLPDWKLRVHLYKSNATPPKDSRSPSGSGVRESASDERLVFAALRRLGAEVILSNDPQPPRATLGAVIGTTSDSDYVLLRSPDWRLSRREATAVADWVRAVEIGGGGTDVAAVHCIHDHETHAPQPMVAGLWGFRPTVLRRRLSSDQFLLDGEGMMTSSLWSLVADAAYCHDSVTTCFAGPPANVSKPFPVVEGGPVEGGFVGEAYDEHDDPMVRTVAANSSLGLSAPCAVPTSWSKNIRQAAADPH